MLSSSRKQYTEYKDDFNEYKFTDIKMWGTTMLHSWATPFLIDINDLSLVSKYLSPIMFAYDTNLFYSHKSIKIK